MSVLDLLGELGKSAEAELAAPVTIEDSAAFPGPDVLYLEKRVWKRASDVVCVVTDLKHSTRLNFETYAPSSASLYEAVTGNAVRIVGEFDPQYVDIQGDGLFALYHGTLALERALCAGVTLKTFSERYLEPAIDAQFSGRFPETGLKVGIASGIVAAKNVGVRGRNEPVWAGKPVNWASKCAEHADAHQLIVTERVFNRLGDNDYVRYSCGCGTGGPGTGLVRNLWSEETVTALDDRGSRCMRLGSIGWCQNCGSRFCEAILGGDRRRGDIPANVRQ